MNPEPYEGDKYEPIAEGETAAEYNRRKYPALMDRLDNLTAEMGSGTGEIKTQRDVPLVMVTGRVSHAMRENLDAHDAAEKAAVTMGVDYGSTEARILAMMAEQHDPATGALFSQYYHDYQRDVVDRITADADASIHHMQGLGGNGRRFFLLPDIPAPEEQFSGDETHDSHNRRRVGKQNHKDRRLESRDAKQAMIDRALAKMKKGKR